MTKKITFAVLALVMLAACKKEVSSSETNSISTKVNIWLDRQKTEINKVNVNKQANIETLRKNLDFQSAKIEEKDQNYNFLIIPIKDQMIIEKSLDKNSTLMLLLIVDKIGEIISGHVIYFIPSDGKKHKSFSANAFKNIFDNKPVSIEGMFKFLSITGRWLYEFQYKNNQVYSIGTIQAKEGDVQRTSSIVCINWYLITTYYYPDGTTYQTTEYVGTTCEGCDNLDYQSLCPDEGNGGGSGDSQYCNDSAWSSGVVNASDLESISTTSESAETRTKTYHWVFSKGALNPTLKWTSHETGVMLKKIMNGNGNH